MTVDLDKLESLARAALESLARAARPPVTVDLDKLESLARAATPGPWHPSPRSDHPDSDHHVLRGSDAQPLGGRVARIMAPGRIGADTAAYIAAASPDVVLALIERCRYAERVLGALEHVCSDGDVVERALHANGWPR